MNSQDIICEKKELVALKKAKLKECKANKRYHKEEYRAYKKKIKVDRKAIKEEYDQKIDELVLKTEEAIGEIKVKEKDLTPEEIGGLLELAGSPASRILATMALMGSVAK